MPLLAVEIRTLKNSPISNPEQLPVITIFEDEQNNYFLATGLDEIQTAIGDLIPYLNTNTVTNIVFAVEILPGDESDAISFH